MVAFIAARTRVRSVVGLLLLVLSPVQQLSGKYLREVHRRTCAPRLRIPEAARSEDRIGAEEAGWNAGQLIP